MNERKIVILLGDGMADLPIESFGNRTFLQYANTPNMDSIAVKGIAGMAKTVPDGMGPGSDTANLSIFGYNPKEHYTGRAPLEALNIGIKLAPNDAAFRCNLVNIKNDIMNDFSADHIDTEFASIVINELADNIKIPDIEFYSGVSYRNIVVWRNFPYDKITSATPPHDITDKNILNYLPHGDGADVLFKIMEESVKIISQSETIKKAATNYKGNPTSAWLWGGGRCPNILTLKDKFGLEGHTISAVDLIHGIGRAAGLSPIPVEGATGYIDTNYAGKVAALRDALKLKNFVYLHVEAPDESGHKGNIEHKLQAVQDFDAKVVGPVLEILSNYKEYSLLVMPDHPTPIVLKTHTSDPVPFCMLRTGGFEFNDKHAKAYNEVDCSETGLFIEDAHRLIELMIFGELGIKKC